MGWRIFIFRVGEIDYFSIVDCLNILELIIRIHYNTDTKLRRDIPPEVSF